MGEVSAQVGKKVRQIRQAKKLSLSDFSAMIHKSKSTLSKYENGEIALDMETLFEIARKLDISVVQLLQGIVESGITTQGEVSKIYHEYLYLFDGRSGKIIKGLLETTEYQTGYPASVTLYYNLAAMERPDGYKSLYCGTMTRKDSVTSYTMQNQTNSMESIFMCVLNSLEVHGKRMGIVTGISSRSLMPTSFKLVISDKILEEDAELLHTLVLSREDFALMKRCNMFVFNHEED